MAIMLTDQVSQTQVADGQWITNGNQLALLDDGRVTIVPRRFRTDNITFISDDFADVRASHFHDVGCKYHQMIYVSLSVAQLRKCGFLIVHNGKWYCKDIPTHYLYVENVTFNKINNIFKQCLLACHTGVAKTNIMRFAVNFNLGWARDNILWLFKPKKNIDLNKFYKEEW